MLPKTINVSIPPEEWSNEVYQDNKDCYLAKALKNQGFNNVGVSGNGYTFIDNILYIPQQDFNSDILKEAFEKGETTNLTLIQK